MEAVQYIDDYVDHNNVPKRIYELYIVHWGQGYSRSDISWSPLGTLMPSYVAYWYPQDLAKTRSHVIGTFAHETTHLFADLLESQRRNDDKEFMAYLAATCAQLQLAGEVRARDLGWAVPDGIALSSEARLSAKEGSEFALSLQPLFVDGTLTRDSTAGRDFQKRCNRELTEYFEAQR